jgi:ATP-dependent Lhr-like helicase
MGFRPLRALAPVRRWEKTQAFHPDPARRALDPFSGSRSGGGSEARINSWAILLLRRYGVVFRDLLTRESVAPAWWELLRVFRRMEARGEIRGGRFVSGVAGEQYALPEAVEALRRPRESEDHWVILSAADPLNLTGIVIPGPEYRRCVAIDCYSTTEPLRPRSRAARCSSIRSLVWTLKIRSPGRCG